MLEPLRDASEQSEFEKKLVSHIDEKIDECRQMTSRVANESQWMKNMAYTIGFSGLRFNQTLRQFEPINRTYAYLRQNRLYCNIILPTLQVRTAKLCQSQPKFDVRPATSEPEAKDQAELALQVLINQWDKLRLDEKRVPLMMYAQQAGHAYIKICWDEGLGSPIMDPLTGDLAFEGDIRAEIASPFEMFPNPHAKSWDEVERTWLIQAKVRPLDYFRTQYPNRGDAVKEESVTLMSLQYEARVNTMTTRGSGSGGQTPSFKNCAIEKIKYEAPSLKHPQGRMIVSASGVLLEDKPLPIGMIPFAMFSDIVVAGKFYPEAVTTHLTSIQDQYNEVIRRRAQWENRLLAGKLTAPRGANLSPEGMNDQSGEIVYYTPVPNAPDGGRPMAISMPNIPQYAFTEEDRLMQMTNMIAGLSEVSRGTLPSAQIPAIGMQLLLEADATRAGVEILQHELAWSRVGEMVLKYVREYYKTPKKLKSLGKAKNYVIREYTGDMLGDELDVTVIRGSTTPQSKVLRRNDIMNLLSTGVLGNVADPAVRQKVLDDIEFGDYQDLFEQSHLFAMQIKECIKMIENGKVPPVHELDNHALFIEKLNDFRISPKGQALDPMRKAILEKTTEDHIQWMMRVSNAVPPTVPPELEQAKDDLNQKQTDIAHQHEVVGLQAGGGPPQ